jgi:hypothetical protein
VEVGYIEQERKKSFLEHEQNKIKVSSIIYVPRLPIQSLMYEYLLYVMCARREGLVGQEFNYFKQQPLSPNQTANKSLGNQRFRRTAEPVPQIPILVTKY